MYDSLSKGFLYKVVINGKQQTSSNSCSLVYSNFSIEYRSSLKLHCFCFTSHCYWCRKLASLPRPIRCKSKTNHDLVARIFPRFRQFGSFYSEFSLALKILSFFWLAVVITLVLVSRHSIKTHLITLWLISCRAQHHKSTTLTSIRRSAAVSSLNNNCARLETSFVSSCSFITWKQ